MNKGKKVNKGSESGSSDSNFDCSIPPSGGGGPNGSDNSPSVFYV